MIIVYMRHLCVPLVHIILCLLFIDEGKRLTLNLDVEISNINPNTMHIIELKNIE